jgi:hypothetical protein
VATLALGCLYLSTALFGVWILKSNFNFLGFIFNPVNKKFYFISDLIFISLCILAISEQVHSQYKQGLLILFLLMHVYNSGILLFDSKKFYESKDQMRELGEDALVYAGIFILSTAGIICIYIAYS